MTWHTWMTTPETLTQIIGEIRQRGGTVASCQRMPTGLIITWFAV